MLLLYVLIALLVVFTPTTPYSLPPSYPHQNRRNIIQNVGSSLIATSSILLPPFPSSASPLVPQVKAGRVNMSKTIQGYWQLAGGHGKYDIENVHR